MPATAGRAWRTPMTMPISNAWSSKLGTHNGNITEIIWVMELEKRPAA